MEVNTAISKFTEVVVRIIPPSRHDSPNPAVTTEDSAKGLYDALIYAEIPIPAINEQGELPTDKIKIAGLPYVGREIIKIKWECYEGYLSAFVEGAEAFVQMRERLFETLPPGLESLFMHPPTNQPIRLWLSIESPELVELPWELLLHQSLSDAYARFTLVRGLPPETLTPIIPITERVRVVVIYCKSLTPPGLLQAFSEIDDQIEVVYIDSPLRKSLEKVASEGFEIVHIVSDGIASLGFEGILYMHNEDSSYLETPSFNIEPNERSIVPTELSSIFSGCRSSILCMTPQNYNFPDTMLTTRNRQIRSVFRAFAYIGNSKLPMPSIVAPLGPLSDFQTKIFWKQFYMTLNETLSLQQAMMKAQSGHEPFPMALFLRHFQSETFRRATPETITPENDPVNVGADLQFSKDLLSELSAHQEKYGQLPAPFNDFVENEQIRQKDLSERLNNWFIEEETKHD